MCGFRFSAGTIERPILRELLGTCRELVYSAAGFVVGAIGLRGANCVVVGRPRLKTVHIHPVNHIWQVPVPPIGRFSRVVKVVGLRTVMHDTVMYDRSSGGVGRPSDNG